MINNPIIFYLASFLIIVFALLTLFAKNVVYSLLASVVVFFLGALFFYILGSEYNAIIQAAIYGLAVPIIIGLSIMFTTRYDSNKKGFLMHYFTVLCIGIFILAFSYLVMISLTIIPDTFHIMDFVQINSLDSLRAFAHGIFVDYVWAFELVSLLLTIVIAGIGLIRSKTWK